MRNMPLIAACFDQRTQVRVDNTHQHDTGVAVHPIDHRFDMRVAAHQRPHMFSCTDFGKLGKTGAGNLMHRFTG